MTDDRVGLFIGMLTGSDTEDEFEEILFSVPWDELSGRQERAVLDIALQLRVMWAFSVPEEEGLAPTGSPAS